MILKSIEWRNFKSYSNIPTIINFDSINSVNLIIGDNGTGKSSIEEVIKFTLYGKLEDYNNSDIPNRINKNFYSKIEVECDGHVIIIERGLAPTIFAVSIDGEKIDTAGKSNVQNMLEEMYFKMPYSVFSNTLVLSVNSFKSLIDLNASEKRSILDKIFKFDQYNQILKLAKEDYKGITSNISRNEGSIQYSYNVKQNYEHQIEEIKKNEVSQEEIDNLQNQLDELNELYQQKIKMIGKLQDMEKKLKEDISNHRGQFNELKIHINEIDKKIALIDSGKCPTCGTNLDTDDFKKEKEELTKEKEEYINKQKTLQELAKNVMSKIDVLERKESTFQNEIKDMRISDLKSELKYKSNMKGKSIEPILKLKANTRYRITGEILQIPNHNSVFKFVEADGTEIQGTYVSMNNRGGSDYKKFEVNNTFTTNTDGDIYFNTYPSHSQEDLNKLKAMASSGMYTNQEIANALGCSPSTVSQYLNA